MTLGRSYWSEKSLRERRKAKLKQLQHLDRLIEMAAKMPPPSTMSPEARAQRYQRVLKMRIEQRKTFREIGMALGVSATRAQRLHDDATIWRNTKRSGNGSAK